MANLAKIRHRFSKYSNWIPKVAPWSGDLDENANLAEMRRRFGKYSNWMSKVANLAKIHQSCSETCNELLKGAPYLAKNLPRVL